MHKAKETLNSLFFSQTALLMSFWNIFCYEFICIFRNAILFLSTYSERRIILGGLKNRLQQIHLMMSEAPLMNNEVYNHNLTGMTPAEIAEHLKDVCPEFGDLNIEELLLMQVH